LNCINLILISDSANARDFLSDGDVYFSIISNINIKILKAIILDTKRGTQKSYSLILFRLSLTRDFLSMFVLSVLKTELLCFSWMSENWQKAIVGVPVKVYSIYIVPFDGWFYVND